MDYQTRQQAGFTIVALSGEVDMHSSPRAREVILATLKQRQHILVDLAEVSYIDSSGVASLVEGFQYARKHQLRFGLLGVSHAAMQVLQLARLDTIFPIHASIEAAR